MTDTARRLRDLIEAGDHFVAAEAYSALTGRIVERVGFKAAYTGGHACGAFHYAVPDLGVFSQVEQIEQTARIAGAIDIPLIADADTLGETVADAFHLARRYVRAGIAGIHVEDESSPRHSSYAGPLVSIADMQARIDAAARARGGSAFVIVARCDEMYRQARGGGGSGSVDEAIARGNAYAEAGADALVYPVASAEETAAIVAGVSLPVCTLGFDLPDTAFTLSTGWGWTGAAQLHLARARELMATGRVEMDFVLPDKAELLEQTFYDDLVRDWAGRTGRPTR